MLTQGAKRQAHQRLSRNVRACYQQLQLPWLCPAVHALASRPPRRRLSTIVFTSAVRSAGRCLVTSARKRHQTNAAQSVYENTEDAVPFLDLTPGQETLQRNDDLTKPRRNGDDIVIMRNQSSRSLPIFKKGTLAGISGDVEDLMSNLHACAKVGRYERAAKLIRKLSEWYVSTAPELEQAHHVYLSALLDALEVEKTKERFLDMQKWFELEVRGKEVPPSARILALMLKSVFLGQDQSRWDRYFRRYFTLADEAGKQVGEDIKRSAIEWEYFTQEEFDYLRKLVPEFETVASEPEKEVRKPPPLWHNTVDVSRNAEIDADEDRSQLPLIRAAEQGKTSLAYLTKSLLSMYELEEDWEISGYSLEYLNRLRQERLEKDVRQAAISRWEEESRNLAAARANGQKVDSKLGPYVFQWLKEMTEHIKDEIKKSEEVEAKDRVNFEEHQTLDLGPALQSAKPEKLAAAALMSFIDQVAAVKTEASAEVRPATFMIAAIGSAISMEMQLSSLSSSVLKKYKALPSRERRLKIKRLLKNSQPSILPAQQEPEETEEAIGPGSLSGDHGEDDVMTQGFRLRIGAWFLALILKIAKLPVKVKNPETGEMHEEMLPAASHGWSFIKGQRRGNIRTNPELMRRLTTESVGSYISKPLPMLCEPVSWTGMQKGAYLRLDPISARIMAVRINDKSKAQGSHLWQADKDGHMTRLFEGLNVLSKTPWRVNRPLLKIMIDAWNSGERIGKLAPGNAEEYVDSKQGVDPAPVDSSDRAAYRKYVQLKQLKTNEINSFKSQRAYQNFQLEVARAFADESAFYTPHNVDFRGRAYPIPPYFNHMGADYVRSLFTFAKGKRLGQVGLRWLKIQVANQYGFDKERLDDRVEFAEEHLADVYESVEKPLTGKRWWLTAGHPWQCLAACIELKSALDSPIPEDYLSHLPIQQDGTCNGLQHYAALGGDAIGAQQVNLMPGDRPSDIYSAVKDYVVQDIRVAAEEGHPYAKILDGHITRKVVKQPVMTNVYGVTYHGAKEQVKKQLLDIIPASALTDAITYQNLSAYVTKLIFSALGRMFTGAQAIQLWLGECGARISQSINPDQVQLIIDKRNADPSASTDKRFKKKVLAPVQAALDNELYQFKSPIIWTTPIGMPVVQPYRMSRTKVIRSALQQITLETPSMSDPVSKRKQLQAFPPNFIHSLDSTHMMLSAIKSNARGLTFSSVHDSFWTHASDIPEMSAILRDAFVDMHEEHIVDRLHEEMQKRYSNFLHHAPIDSSSALGQRITALRKSRGTLGRWTEAAAITNDKQVDELIEEYTRQQLLKSQDAEERAKGQAMVTPASLYEAAEEAETLPVLEAGEVPLLGSQAGDSANVKMAVDAEAEIQEEAEEVEDAMANNALDAAEDEDVPGSEGAEALATDDAEGMEAANEDNIDVDDNSPTDLEDLDDIDVEDIDAEPLPTTKRGRGKGKKPAKTTKAKSSRARKTPKAPKEPKPRKEPKVVRRLHIWLPLKFPDTPERGSFDVKLLKDSAYFFS